MSYWLHQAIHWRALISYSSICNTCLVLWMSQHGTHRVRDGMVNVYPGCDWVVIYYSRKTCSPQCCLWALSMYEHVITGQVIAFLLSLAKHLTDPPHPIIHAWDIFRRACCHKQEVYSCKSFLLSPVLLEEACCCWFLNCVLPSLSWWVW